MREQDRHFLWSLYSVIAIIFLWKGFWDGIYEIPYIGHPFVFLFIGFAMLLFSGIFFREFDPLGGLERGVTKMMQHVYHHPDKKQFTIQYYDKALRRNCQIKADQIKSIEHNTLVIKHHRKKQELFIPLHRITEVRYEGKSYWRL